MLETTKVELNDLISLTHYARIKSFQDKETEILVTDLDNGMDFSIRGKELIERCFSADQFTKEEKVNLTQLAKIFVKIHDRPFTVAFTKANKEERILRGRIIERNPVLGRSMVEDLDVQKERIRWVDHRTLKWLIVDNVKYIIKNK